MARASCHGALPWALLLTLPLACAPSEDGTTADSGQLGTTTSSGSAGASAATADAVGGPGSSGGAGGSGGSGAAGGSGGTSETAGSLGGSGGAPLVDGTTGSAGTGGASTLGPVTIYYLDVTEDRVMSLDAEGGPPLLVVEGAGEGPDGIAVDAEAELLYWTNMGVPAEDDGFILRSEFDGSEVTTIVEPGETFTPKQLKLEAGTGKLYWGDREGMRVMRCNLDGSQIEVLVTIAEGEAAREDRANHAVGVAVDPTAGYFYWIQKGAPNAGEGSIRRAGIVMPSGENDRTRSDIEVLYAGLPEPIDLDVDAGAGMMYWTDRGDATINRASIEIPDGATASTRQDREILVDDVDVAIGIWLDLPAGHVYYTGTDVVGRVDLDGDNNSALVRNAGVLTGITGMRQP